MTLTVQADNTVEKAVPGLIIELCNALIQEKILYCHWKSNNQLERTSYAETDLDLLICRTQADEFTRILIRLGFKAADAPPDKRIPGILDYYGYDQPTGKLVHVHAHYQLVLGHDTTKNYRLPVEKEYLQSGWQDRLFLVPDPAFEYIIFVIRMILKHFTWDAILINHGRLSSAERAEIAYLKGLLIPGDFSTTLDKLFAFLPTPVFENCVRALEKDCSTVSRIRAGNQLLNVLHPYARRHRLLDIGLKIYRRLSWGVQRKIFKRSRKRRLCNGGLLVAVVGGDGAGKSTSLEHLNAFLSEHLDVVRLHVGKPAWSWGTKVVRAILKVGRTMGLYSYIDHTIRYDPDRQAALGFPGYPCLIREVCTARDRFHALSTAMKHATNGIIVLCDRYPVSGIQLMEGPVVEQLAGKERERKLVRILINWEESYYKRIKSSDILIVLRLDPMTAVARKPEEDSEFVRMRSEEIWQCDWSNSEAVVVDSSKPVSDVLSTLRSRIWAAL